MTLDHLAQLQREQLHYAAGNGDLERVEKLLAQHYPVNRFDELAKTPLHYAVSNEHYEVIERLLAAGADVNAHDDSRIGNTPLRDVVGECTQLMAKFLLDAGADPTIPGWMQLTAIRCAELRKDADKRKIVNLLKQAAKRFNKS